jgi:hypothetical protein
MKPQAMGAQEFFLALCRELGLSPTDSDEENIINAVRTNREWSAVWKQAAKTHRKFGEQMAQRVEDAEQGWHDEVTSGYDNG